MTISNYLGVKIAVEAYLCKLINRMNGKVVFPTKGVGCLGTSRVYEVEKRFETISQVLEDLGIPFLKEYRPNRAVAPRIREHIMKALHELAPEGFFKGGNETLAALTRADVLFFQDGEDDLEDAPNRDQPSVSVTNILDYLGRLQHKPKREFAELYLKFKISGAPRPKCTTTPKTCDKVKKKIDGLLSRINGAEGKTELRLALGLHEDVDISEDDPGTHVRTHDKSTMPTNASIKEDDQDGEDDLEDAPNRDQPSVSVTNILDYLGRLQHKPKREFAELYLKFKISGAPRPKCTTTPKTCDKVKKKIDGLLSRINGAEGKTELRLALGLHEDVDISEDDPGTHVRTHDKSTMPANASIKEDDQDGAIRDQFIANVSTAYDAADAFVNSLAPRDRKLLEARIIAPKGKKETLQTLGNKFGVSRERARQLETRVKRNMSSSLGRYFGPIANTVRKQLGPVISELDISGAEKRFFDVSERPGTELARALLRQALEQDGLEPLLRALKDKVQENADLAGLVRTDSLRELLPDESWFGFMPLLLKRAGLVETFDHTALRGTLKAKIISAMYSADRPVTKKEIAELTGSKEQSVNNFLNSFEPVARVDRNRWWFRDLIDDVYEGVPLEIIQRIDEDGGATTMKRLLEELPKMFKVKPESVRVYVSGPGFVLRDGLVSRADPEDIEYRDLNEVIDGRTAEDLPYWVFEAKEEYRRGFSLQAFPKELAKELGAGPDKPAVAPIRAPKDCEPLTISWNSWTPSGPSLGKLNKPLTKLHAKTGDQIRLTMCPDSEVTLELHIDDGTSTPEESSEEILEWLKGRI